MTSDGKDITRKEYKQMSRKDRKEFRDKLWDEALDTLELLHATYGVEREEINEWIGGEYYDDLSYSPPPRRSEFAEAMSEAIRGAKREAASLEIAGEPGLPYASLALILKEGLVELRGLMVHTHRWDDNGFCMECGLDGNA